MWVKTAAMMTLLGRAADGLRDVRTSHASAVIQQVDPIQFSYDNVNEWKADCRGAEQSPIDIFTSQIPPLPDVASSIGERFTSLPQRGRNLTSYASYVGVEGNFGQLSLPDGVYDATGFHIHVPSEHAIDGILAAGEMHITFERYTSHKWNRTVPDATAIVAVLLQDSAHIAGSLNKSYVNETADFFDRLGLNVTLPPSGSQVPIPGELDISLFKKAMQGNYYHYKGSLTTPPCTELVHWYVLEKPGVVRPETISSIMKNFTQGSNRPVQALNQRKVLANSISIPDEQWGDAPTTVPPVEMLEARRTANVPGDLAAVIADIVPVDESSPTHWDYKDKDRWLEMSADCKGSEQSPIDIITSKVAPSKQGVSLKNFVNYQGQTGARLFNNGHSIQVDGDFGSLTLPDGVYYVKQFHFHFPSEHAINHLLATGELHIVHQREDSSASDALAVVAILLQDEDLIAADLKDEKANYNMNQFWNRMGAGTDLPNEGESARVTEEVHLGKVFDHALSKEFYHYKGSLTTPPCAETVHWYVMEKPAAVSKKMIESYKNAFHDPTGQNRQVQALNGRAIVNTDVSLPGEFPKSI